MNDWFDHAFRGLTVAVPKAEQLHLANVVHQCMEAKTRNYHTSFHVLGLCEGMQPIQVLAALFHDVVFYQVDGGFPACVSALLEQVTCHEPGLLRLREVVPEDQAMSLCLDIFGFHAGQRLSPRQGMNEFLSAVVAARLLHAHLSTLQLMAVVACIELTIPFRGPDAKGHTATQRLAQRVQAAHARWASAQRASDPTFVKTTVTQAVDLANRDVTGFIEASPQYCLVNSMLLVEESMMPRAAAGKKSLQAYRSALLGMDNFLSHLNPAWVGQSFDGYPPGHEVMQMQATAERNISFVRDYLAAVLNIVAIIEALTKCAGISFPMALALIGMNDTSAARLPAPPARSTVRAGVHQLLKNGLADPASPGLQALPLVACIYAFLGQAGSQRTLQQAAQMFGGNLTPQAFLQNLDRSMLSAIIHLAALMDEAHKEAFMALEHRLYAVHVTN
jgi:hypothetical protein